ncbi:MAG: contractile injection system tape measure protein [Cyanobacteria bacterium P01_D01_bin.44]
MLQQRHIIKQQILDLRIGANIKAFELQNQLSALYRRKIIPLLQTYCDQLSDPDTLIRIDTLDIDLGEINLHTLETDFVTKAEAQLSQQLAQQLGSVVALPAPGLSANQVTPAVKASKPAPLTMAIPNHLAYSPAHPLPTSDGQDVFISTGNRYSSTESQLELFSYFLQTGRLPWWSNTLSPSALDDCCEQLLHTSPAALRALLQTQLKQAQSRQRLIYQFSDSTLINLVNLLAPNSAAWVQPYLQDIDKLIPQVESLCNRPSQQIRLKLWRGIFSSLSLSPTAYPLGDAAIRNHLLHLADSFKINLPTLWQQLLSALEQQHTEGIRFESPISSVLTEHSATTITINTRSTFNTLANLLSELKALESQPPISPSVQAKIDTLLYQLNSLLQGFPNDSADSQSNHRLTDMVTLATQLETEVPPPYRPLIQQTRAVLQSTKPLFSSPASSVPPTLFIDPITPFTESKEIYIQNAGLILLWPFLPRLFETLNLIQANEFVELQTTERAILLLQYLVDAATEIPEHLLPLNKFLCGLDLPTPIAAHLDITDLEKTECDTLLTAAIRNWPALKGTSLDGFRRAFLQRAGILRPYNDNWLLQVERETYDVLLEQLPWSIRVIKFPWMPEVLYVEW